MDSDETGERSCDASGLSDHLGASEATIGSDHAIEGASDDYWTDTHDAIPDSIEGPSTSLSTEGTCLQVHHTQLSNMQAIDPVLQALAGMHLTQTSKAPQRHQLLVLSATLGGVSGCGAANSTRGHPSRQIPMMSGCK